MSEDKVGGVSWWKLWEGLDVKNSKRVKCNSIGDLEKFMVECGVEKDDVLNKLISCVRNYSYNRGYRKDNYKSDGVLKVEVSELKKEIERLNGLIE